MPEIRKMLVLSTAHIPARLAMQLTARFDPDTEIVSEEIEEVCADPIDGGWLLWINEDDEIRKNLPLEIQALYTYADKFGLRGEYLRLDQDGPIEPDLPTWEW